MVYQYIMWQWMIGCCNVLLLNILCCHAVSDCICMYWSFLRKSCVITSEFCWFETSVLFWRQRECLFTRFLHSIYHRLCLETWWLPEFGSKASQKVKIVIVFNWGETQNGPGDRKWHDTTCGWYTHIYTHRSSSSDHWEVILEATS